ncbi:YggN family protein [Photobacterium nomapromontoriensis]|uniref:YggN family protein n=1 Tax=Photobacterium nomapromontoriensis TaxID=2910237 RepID=UPI003D117FCA
MNKTLIALIFLPMSMGAFAQSCPVNVPNDIHIADDQVSIYQEGRAKLLIDDNNQLFINGKKIDLDVAQQQAMQAYSDHVKQYLPQMAAIADDGVLIAKDMIDELSASFDGNEAFAGANQLVKKYSEEAKQKFYKDGEFVMPADIFSTVDGQWKQDFEHAIKNVSAESMAGILAALSNEMKNGDLNFTEFQQKLSDLKTRMQTRIQERSGDVAEKANNLCDSIQGLAEEEKQLQHMIPELKNYPMFEI